MQGLLAAACGLWASQAGQGQRSRCSAGDGRLHPWVGKISWRRAWQPSPVLLPGKSHGQRSLARYNPWGHKSLTGLSMMGSVAHWPCHCLFPCRADLGEALAKESLPVPSISSFNFWYHLHGIKETLLPSSLHLCIPLLVGAGDYVTRRGHARWDHLLPWGWRSMDSVTFCLQRCAS